MKSRRTLHRMKSWLEASKIDFSFGQNRSFFQHFDQLGLWESLGASGDQSVSLGRLWGARMAQDGAKMVKDGAKPTVRPTDWPSDRPTVRPPDRLHTLTPDQPALLARYFEGVSLGLQTEVQNVLRACACRVVWVNNQGL